MQQKKSRQLFTVTIEFQNGLTRMVRVKAADRKTAENRALKFHPSAIGVKRDVG